MPRADLVAPATLDVQRHPARTPASVAAMIHYPKGPDPLETQMSSIPSLVPRDRYAALDRCTYFNQASLGLIPVPTIDAMDTFLKETAQFGNLYLSDDQEAAILDGVRSAGAEVLGTSSDAVAVVAGASEGLSQVTSLLEPEQGTVLVVGSDFPSVTYPWLAAAERRGISMRFIDDRADRDLTQDLVDAIDTTTVVVAFSVVQYATGTRVDAGRVAERAHEVGARVVVDATQLAGAGVVDTIRWGADALVTSGYKWLSSHGGVALLALAPDLVLAFPPSLAGWGPSARSISIRSRFAWQMTRAASSSRRCRTCPPSGSSHRSRCSRRWGSSASTSTRGVWRHTWSIGSPSWDGARSARRAIHRRRPTSCPYATRITIRG